MNFLHRLMGKTKQPETKIEQNNADNAESKNKSANEIKEPSHATNEVKTTSNPPEFEPPPPLNNAPYGGFEPPPPLSEAKPQILTPDDQEDQRIRNDRMKADKGTSSNVAEPEDDKPKGPGI